MWKKRLRFSTLLVTGILKRYYLYFLSSIAISIVVIYFWPRIQANLPHPRPQLRIGLVGRFDETNLPSFIIKKVSIGLTQIDDNGQPFPGIATNWKSINGGKSWEFTLDPNLTWSDNTPILARDIQYQYEDVKSEIVDDHTIRYNLPEVFSPFPVIMSKPVFKNRTGIGPYKITKVQRQGQNLKRIDFTPISKTSTLPGITYQFYPTEESAKLGFKLGEIDQILEMYDPSGFDGWRNVEIAKQIKPNRYVGIFFNQNGGVPDLKEKQFRQALAYAIQDKSLGNPRAISSIPQNSWAYNPNVKPYDFDLDRAKGFLAKPGAKDVVVTKLTLTTVSDLLPVAEKIAQDWQAINVQAEISVVSAIPDQFDVLLATQEVPQDPDQYTLWHSTQAGSRLSYQNPKIDKLLEDGRKTLNQDDRKQIYFDFQRFLNEDVPVIFLYHPSTYTLKRK